MDEMQTAIGWRQDGYSCEWRIDITRASGGQVRLQPDVEWGFDLSIWDRDLKGDNSWIAWSRGIGKYRRTDRLGTLAAMRTDASLNEIVARIGTISDKRDHLPGISGSVAGYQMFFSGVLMAITFLHLLLFLFNRETRANLFYAFYTAAIGAAIFSGLQMEFYSYMDPDSIRAAQKLTLLFISLFGLAFLYSLFGPVPRRFYFELGLVILPAAISSISFIVFSQESNVALGFASGIRGLLGLLIALASGLILLETILVLFRSVRRGLEGAWIIGAGFVIFTTNISSLVYKTETEFSALYWVLIPLISMSVLLARRVGKTHQELKTRLFQVEQLSAKTQQQYEQIEQQNLQIQEANRLKSDFLARMSHDLRTPMNAIIGYTRILLRKTRDVLDDRHYKNLENVNLSAHKLLVLINDILDLSKIEAGRIDIKVEPVNLKTLAQECATSIESLLKPGVELRYELADVPPFHTDADRLHRALMNLLGNAVKFTHQGSITVALRPHNDGIELSVIDTGEGIPQKDLPHIFDEFRQVDASNGARHEGTGLGLAIVKKSVELLAGSVTVESEEGVGSRFTLWIKDYPQNGT